MSHLDDEASARVHTIEDLAIITPPGTGQPPALGPYGCVITADGTTYTLTEQHTHGMLLALIFPDQAAAAGYAPPDTDSSVHHYQYFELDNKRTLPAVRIATGGLLNNVNVSKSDAPATDAQIQAASAYLMRYGVKLNDKIHLDCGEVTLRKALKFLSMSDEDILTARYGG